MTKRLTTAEFIEKARAVHGDRYDYSRVVYVKSHDHVIIGCLACGEWFTQSPNGHLSGRGCSKCGIKSAAESRSMRLSEFRKRVRVKHGDRVVLDRVKSLPHGVSSMIEVSCSKCGIYREIIAGSLLYNDGFCGYCARNRKLTAEEFIQEARTVHGDLYDYSDVVYLSGSDKVKIRCTRCDLSWDQLPTSHLLGYGCPKCAIDCRADKRRMSRDEFIDRARDVHGNLYDYSSAEYVNSDTKVTIRCGSCKRLFNQSPETHINRGYGCPHCAGRTPISFAEFVSRARGIWGDNYDYDENSYSSISGSVSILCKECNEWFSRKANHHASIIAGGGCPTCNDTRSSGEKVVCEILDRLGIEYRREVSLEGMGKQRFDFWIPDKDTAIEYHGSQHFAPVEFLGGTSGFKKRIELDRRKKRFCAHADIRLIILDFRMSVDEMTGIVRSSLL